MADGHVYFHSPCFDGIASAVLAWDFLDARRGWTSPTLRPVNYDVRDSWLRGSLERPSAIVDFLYHPDACFWADHHPTTFLTSDARRHFEVGRGPELIYDEHAGSCAMVLWEHLAQAFGHRTGAYAELVRWADKIDAARYVSVAEAMDASAPALRLNLSLAIGNAREYSEALVRALRRQSLDEVADLPEASRRFREARALADAGLDRFANAAHLEADGIVVFDVDAHDALVNRYAPYHLYPNARYSAGVVRSKHGATVTAMRNPWRDFESVPLGRIAETLGGGGHQRVGSIALGADQASGAGVVLAQLVQAIRSQETTPRQRSAAEASDATAR